ncbi:MAG TPA: MlaD family protein [Solirubrobacteraceae bacterium]|jgi:phospholipid/cholesterol/gamma-HCH transport system substrate-binding protein|nr:MlaD family protein [Solirubrobacteraceae bacterium]
MSVENGHGARENGGVRENGAVAREDGGRGIRDQIERYRTAFIAVVAMIVIAAGSAGYILAHERLSVPSWVPVIGHEHFLLKGEFSTAQAVAPGQGQEVTIAGAKIGEIASVELRSGRALVSMNLTPSYARYIYRDATMLLRPKTSLKDETVEVDPGSPAAGRVSAGYTVPIAQTSPDGNLDELLAALDTETRAALQELLAGAGEGLQGNGANLSATLKRFAPIGHELDAIGREVATRQADVASSIHNFGLLMEALGNKDTELGALVDSSNAVFATFSQQDREVQETLRELPGALKATNQGLAKASTAFHLVGPTLKALEPFAKALAPSQRAARSFFEQTTPILASEVRPLLRKILPVLNTVSPSVNELSKAFPQLKSGFGVFNELLNEIAYNPGPNQGGFLFFLDWANHNLNSVVSQGDANGAFGQTLVYYNCNLVPLLKAVGEADPTAGLILGLLNPPSPALCSSVGAASSGTAKAARLERGVSPVAQLGDHVFGQGPDAAARLPIGGQR